MVRQMKPLDAVPLFNSPMETGLRAVIVLDACFPKRLDVTSLSWLDHLVVHTADIGGPASLHPNVPQRTGELLVRRRLIEDGLSLMRKLHLIEIAGDETGFTYKITEEATAFVDSLNTKYASTLKDRARWLADLLEERDYDLSNLIDEKIGRWALEFQTENNAPGKLL